MVTVTTAKDEVSVVIDGLASALAQPGLLMPPLAVALQRETATIFREQSDPVTGARWKPTGSLALSTRPGGGSNGQTLLDTGQLRNALVSAKPKIVGNQVSVDTAGVPYAALNNFGGVVKPRNAEMLAIPLTREARLAGSARRWWGKNEARKPFVGRFNGKLFIATSQEGGDGLDLHFILKPSVTIPQRRFIGVSPRLVKSATTIANAVVAKIIADAKRKA